jgi:histidyl-tRNA synthetase
MGEGLKGFRTVYPDEMARRRWIIDTLETTARSYGFVEVGTPALERTQLYVDKSGPGIVDELYRFTDKGGRDVTLTPELTPTVARMVVDRQQAMSKPIKWVSTRPFWRYEQVQRGRFREFYQTNIDIFGSAEPTADAEVLAVAADGLAALGLDAGKVEFRISHRAILTGLLEARCPGADHQAAIRAIDKRDKLEQQEYVEALTAAGIAPEEADVLDELLSAGDLDAVADAGGSTVAAAVENLQAVLSAAAELGVDDVCRVDLQTARGLDYYTGIVFECFDTMGAVDRSIFGGGRYDDLIEAMGGQPTPAVGVAPGLAPLSLACATAEVGPTGSPGPTYYLLTVGDVRATAAPIARALRARGHTVEMDVAGRSFGAQLDYADAVGAETVIIVGERDLEAGEVTIKDMRTGVQTSAPVDAVPGPHERPTVADYSE